MARKENLNRKYFFLFFSCAETRQCCPQSLFEAGRDNSCSMTEAERYETGLNLCSLGFRGLNACSGFGRDLGLFRHWKGVGAFWGHLKFSGGEMVILVLGVFELPSKPGKTRIPEPPNWAVFPSKNDFPVVFLLPKKTLYCRCSSPGLQQGQSYPKHLFVLFF